MKICKKLVMLATAVACLAGALPAQAAPTALFDADYPIAGGISDTPVVYGNRFTMTSTITATALGLFDKDSNGFVESHQVGLMNDAGSLLASVTFGPGQAGTLGPGVKPGDNSLLNSGMRYLDIADVLLEAGQSYWLASIFPAPMRDYFGLAWNVSSSYASDFSGTWGWGSTLARPGNASGELYGMNLLFDDGTGNGGGNTVPEPATLIQVLTLLGALVLVRRRRA